MSILTQWAGGGVVVVVSEAIPRQIEAMYLNNWQGVVGIFQEPWFD